MTTNTRHLTVSCAAILCSRPTVLWANTSPLLRQSLQTSFRLSSCSRSYAANIRLRRRPNTVNSARRPFSQPPPLQNKVLPHVAFSVSTCLACFGTTAWFYNEKLHRDVWVLDRWQRYFQDQIIPKRQYSQPTEEIKRVRAVVGRWWDGLPESRRTVYQLMAVNAVVFALWQIPSFGPFMARTFIHVPGGTAPYTLLTSVFSHHDFWHFGINMLALSSVGGIVCELLGREQFLAFYISAGVASSLFSHILRNKLNVDPHIGGLGASGALYGCFALTALKFPEASGHIMFLPFIPIKLLHMLPAMVTFDIIGIVRGWKTFDHFAHLGGAMFGAAYFAYGQEHIWRNSCVTMSKIRHRLEQK